MENLISGLHTNVWADVALGSLLLFALVLVVSKKTRTVVAAFYRWLGKATGGWWVLVRLGLALPLTVLIFHYEKRVAEIFPRAKGWVGEDLLAFVAVIFAIVQFLDARGEEKEMREVNERMNEVVNKMSTRGIGAFPKNMDSIIELVKSAKHSIRIIVDYPGYGQYSAPQRHQEYLAVLGEAAANRDIEFQLVSYDDVLASQESAQEFPAANIHSMRKADLATFKLFFEFRGIPEASRPSTCGDLWAFLQEVQNENLKILANGVQHESGLQQKYLSERAPLFLWLVDDREAVFTFKNLDKNEEAYSIRTTDGWLVRNLTVHFEHTFNHANTSYQRIPRYKLLMKSTAPLSDGQKVTITGHVSAQESAVVVESIT